MERGEEGRLIGQSKVWFPGLLDFLDADVIGSDPTHDIAVLKVSSKHYNPTLSNPLKLIPKSIPKGTSRFLQVGQTCLALPPPPPPDSRRCKCPEPRCAPRRRRRGHRVRSNRWYVFFCVVAYLPVTSSFTNTGATTLKLERYLALATVVGYC
jgi:hypothetical protein